MSLSFPTMATIRFGRGLRPGEAPPQTKDDLIGQVTRGADGVPGFPVGSIDARHTAILDLQDRLKQIRQADGDDLHRRQQRRLLQRRAQMLFQMDANARLMQAVLSPDGFNERLATFWTNHFSTSAGEKPADAADRAALRGRGDPASISEPSLQRCCAAPASIPPC